MLPYLYQARQGAMLAEITTCADTDIKRISASLSSAYLLSSYSSQLTNQDIYDRTVSFFLNSSKWENICYF